VSDVEPAGAPPDPRDLRCSDTDRERVAEALRTALADGRIDLDELSDRLDRTYAARTYRDLEPLVADLPGTTSALPVPRAGTAPAPLAGGSLDRVGGLATSGSAIAIMGGASRKGLWTVPPSFTAVAVMGGVELDLTQARFESPRVTITAVAFWGGIEIKAPADVAVQVDGVGIMGGFDGPRDTVPQEAGVTVRVTGMALMGGIEVKRPEPGTGTTPKPR
jgi:hypothetical protein